LVVLLSVLVLCIQGTARAQAGGWSRNCSVKKAADDLNPGTYTGNFDVKVTAKGGPALMNLEWTLWIRGTMRLVVNEIGILEGIAGDTKYQFGGAGEGAASMLASVNFDGGGPLKMAGRLENQRFGAVADIKAPGSISAQGAGGGASYGGVGAGDLHLTFTINEATCDKASGTFVSPEVGQTITALKEGGFVISGSPAGTWTMSAGTDMAKKVEDLERELAQPVPGGLTHRDAEINRLGAIALRLQKGPTGEQACLLKIWDRHVRRVLADWVQGDVRKIRSYTGDLQGLESLMRQGLVADSQLSLIGMDQCEAQLHDEIFNAIQSSLARMLNSMVVSHAPVQDLMTVMKEAKLLGDVAPALEQRVVKAILAESKRLADANYRDFRAAQQNHPKEPCHPDVMNPLRKAITAEQEWELMNTWGAGGAGASGGRSVAWLKELVCGGK
jgi:hypothetical protein